MFPEIGVKVHIYYIFYIKRKMKSIHIIRKLITVLISVTVTLNSRVAKLLTARYS